MVRIVRLYFEECEQLLDVQCFCKAAANTCTSASDEDSIFGEFNTGSPGFKVDE